MKTLLALATMAFILQGEKKSHPVLEPLKKLEGTWESSDKDHPARITYKMSSGGSIVVETLSMMNHSDDMVTIYHSDGDRLVMTHYCSLGNQPHMIAEKETTPGTIRFVCHGGANFECPKDRH